MRLRDDPAPRQANIEGFQNSAAAPQVINAKQPHHIKAFQLDAALFDHPALITVRLDLQHLQHLEDHLLHQLHEVHRADDRVPIQEAVERALHDQPGGMPHRLDANGLVRDHPLLDALRATLRSIWSKTKLSFVFVRNIDPNP